MSILIETVQTAPLWRISSNYALLLSRIPRLDDDGEARELMTSTFNVQPEDGKYRITIYLDVWIDKKPVHERMHDLEMWIFELFGLETTIAMRWA